MCKNGGGAKVRRVEVSRTLCVGWASGTVRETGEERAAKAVDVDGALLGVWAQGALRPIPETHRTLFAVLRCPRPRALCTIGLRQSASLFR